MREAEGGGEDRFTLDREEVLSVYAHLRLLPDPDFRCLSVMSRMEKYLGNLMGLEFLINVEHYYLQSGGRLPRNEEEK